MYYTFTVACIALETAAFMLNKTPLKDQKVVYMHSIFGKDSVSPQGCTHKEWNIYYTNKLQLIV